MNDNSCIFCKIIKKEIPAKIVFENRDVVAFEDIKPQAPIHIIIIPKVHIERISDVKKDNINIVADLILAANNIAEDKGIQESGYRVVINCNKDAGQAVFHLHLHLLGGRPMAWPPG